MVNDSTTPQEEREDLSSNDRNPVEEQQTTPTSDQSSEIPVEASETPTEGLKQIVEDAEVQPEESETQVKISEESSEEVSDAATSSETPELSASVRREGRGEVENSEAVPKPETATEMQSQSVEMTETVSAGEQLTSEMTVGEDGPVASQSTEAESTSAGEETPETTPFAGTEDTAGNTGAIPPADTAKHTGKQTRSATPPEKLEPIWHELQKAMESKASVTMRCIRRIRGGLVVAYKGVEGFLPMSHCFLTRRIHEKEVDEMVGKDFEVTIIEMGSLDDLKLVVSRHNILRQEKFAQLEPGMVLEGVVTSIADYGVFVDIGGIDGLVHLSRMSRTRIGHPREMVKKKQKVKVSIVSLDPERERIALSMKEFTKSPWTNVGERYKVGEIYQGVVRNITSFGVYVQLEPGVDGMVHISDLSWTHRLKHPSEVLHPGQEVEVKVLEVIPDKERIGLSYKDTLPNPWPDIVANHAIGTEYEATVKQVTNAGAIVSLPFDVDAFVPRGKMKLRRRRGQKPEDSEVKVSDVLKVRILEIDPDKRSIVCGVAFPEQKDSDRPKRKPREDHRRVTQQYALNESDRNYTLGEIGALQGLVVEEEHGEEAKVPATSDEQKLDVQDVEAKTESVEKTVATETAEPGIQLAASEKGTSGQPAAIDEPSAVDAEKPVKALVPEATAPVDKSVADNDDTMSSAVGAEPGTVEGTGAEAEERTQVDDSGTTTTEPTSTTDVQSDEKPADAAEAAIEKSESEDVTQEAVTESLKEVEEKEAVAPTGKSETTVTEAPTERDEVFSAGEDARDGTAHVENGVPEASADSEKEKSSPEEGEIKTD